MSSSTHYSYATNPQELKNWSEKAALFITKNAVEHNFSPLFFGTGFSGITAITALTQRLEDLNKINYAFLLLRKSNDNNHNNSNEELYFSETVQKQYIAFFVDDFCGTGNTFLNCIKKLNSIFEERNYEFIYPPDLKIQILVNKVNKVIGLTQKNKHGEENNNKIIFTFPKKIPALQMINFVSADNYLS